jgi:hypothetical protein
MEPEALPPLLLHSSPYPVKSHIIESTSIHTLSPTLFLKFSFLIRLGLLISFFFLFQTKIMFISPLHGLKRKNNKTYNFNFKTRKIKILHHLEQ